MGLGRAVARKSPNPDAESVLAVDEVSQRSEAGMGVFEVFDNFSGLIKLVESVSLSRLS